MEAMALINGERMPLASATLSITDDGVARGDGAFETVGVWDGRAFRLDDHLQRLAGSLDAVALPPADLELLKREAESLLDGVDDDGALRIYVTASGTRMLTVGPPPVRGELRSLDPQVAPWIRPVDTYAPAGSKTMSYLPNMAATRRAQRNGADDALLMSLEGLVLEGPTFAVLWVAGGQLFTPPTSLGIVDSISRRTVLDVAAGAGVSVIEEALPLDHLLAADEVMACSSVRPLLSLDRVAEQTFDGPAPVRDRLAPLLDQARRAA